MAISEIRLFPDKVMLSAGNMETNKEINGGTGNLKLSHELVWKTCSGWVHNPPSLDDICKEME